MIVEKEERRAFRITRGNTWRNGKAFSITKRGCKFLIARTRYKIYYSVWYFCACYAKYSDIARGNLFSDLF